MNAQRVAGHTLLGFLLLAFCPEVRTGDTTISTNEMASIYEQVKTPYKHGIILRGESGRYVDCPGVFRHGKKWYMTYIAFDGKGYETRLAQSDDLTEWRVLGPILTRSQTAWDAEQAAGGPSLQNYRWNGPWTLQKHDGRYWASYLGGKLQGYETPPLCVGLATTTHPDRAQEWNRLPENPVLRPDQADARPFERDTLFKSHILRVPESLLGAPFVMYYNARQKGEGIERIGMAVSKDMVRWQRFGDGPVIDNAPDHANGGISGDPQVVRIGKLWVMFYFGAFWRPGAFDTFACSRDLVHWTKWNGPDLIAPSEPWDKEYAHKPWVVRNQGIVYHFYCAVGDQGRVIALATSKPLKQAAAKGTSPAK